MAYNSQKGTQHTGDIQYESDPNDTQIDFENDFVAIKTNGTQRLIVSGSAITASVLFSGSYDVYGNTLRATSVSASTGITGSSLQVGAYGLTNDGKFAISSLTLGGDLVTSTGAELNLLDGSSAGSVVSNKAAIYGAAGQLNGNHISSSTGITGSSLQIGGYGLTNAGQLAISSFNADWTNAGKTIADLGEVTTVDINGGSIDGTAIGATTQSTAKFTTISGTIAQVTTLTGSNISASAHVSASFFFGDGSTLSNLPATGISWDGSTANGVATYKDADEATVESNLTFDGTRLMVAGDALIDKDHTGTSAATVTGLEIDFDKTSATTSNNTMYGLNIDMDNTTATNGNNYMYGLYVTPTLTHAADAGGSFVYGAYINAQGGTNGSSLVQGARIEAGGGDINYGLQLDVEDGGVDLRIESSADNGDYFQIQTTTHGATTITTVDDNATAADLTFTIDGDINLNPAGGNVIVGGQVSATDLSSSTGITGSSLQIGGYGLTNAGQLAISSFNANWTNAGKTIADLGTVTTADINGGTIDGAVIGAAAAAAASGSTLNAANNVQLAATLGVTGSISGSAVGQLQSLDVNNGALMVSATGQVTLGPSAHFADNVGIGGIPSMPLDVQSTSPGMARLANIANDANGAVFRVQNTRADTNAGVADDFCGGVVFMAQDSATNGQQYAKISAKVGDPANGAEDGYMLFEATTAGTMATTYMVIDGRTNAVTSSVTTRVQGALHQDAALYRKYSNKDGNYTLTNSDNIIYMDTASGALTASLPDAATVDGIVYTIKNSNLNPMVIKPNGAQTIDGAPSLTGSIGQSWTLAANGDVWMVLSSHSSSV